MASRPPLVVIVVLLVLAICSMVAAVYFGGMGQTPIAMAGTLLFVALGGLAFELARRRSL